MYGLVLMVAVGGAGDAPAFGKRDKGCLGGCHGDVVVVVSAPACCPAPAPAPVCCPAPERKGLFSRLFKKDKGHCHAPVVCCPTPAPACCTSSTPPAPGGHEHPKPMDAKPEDKKPEEKKAKD